MTPPQVKQRKQRKQWPEEGEDVIRVVQLLSGSENERYGVRSGATAIECGEDRAICFVGEAKKALFKNYVHLSAHQALKEELERYRAALNNIASWKEGSKVTGTFDEPESARIARKALSAHEENL